jgi:hypothetical protein
MTKWFLGIINLTINTPINMHPKFMISFSQFLELAEGKKKEQKRLEEYRDKVKGHVKQQVKSGQGIITLDHPTAPPSAPGSPERQAEIDAMLKLHKNKSF